MSVGHEMLLDEFLPELLRRRLDVEGASRDEVDERCALGAMIFVDIAGFSLATDEFSREGAEGIERLTGLLNATFGHSIAITVAHGGDVVSFAGDAFNALWLVQTSHAPDRMPLADAIVRAGQCALAVQRSFAQHRGAELDFAVTIAVTCGEVAFVEVGGEGERRLYFAAGEVQAQLAETLSCGKPGEVWISGEARTAAGGRLGIRSSIPGPARLHKVRETLEPIPRGLAGFAADTSVLGRRYLPPAALTWLDTGLSRWVAELRTASVAFVGLPMPAFGDSDSLARFQTLVAELIAAIEHYEGGINKLSVDEKGLALIAAWGLPPHSHEDDATRAALCMLDYAEILGRHGVQAKIGVATGTVYSGLIGSELRREYTMMGQAVNIAARFAGHAEDTIVCDLATRKAAASVDFRPTGMLAIKNIRGEFQTFAPTGVRQERVSRSDLEIVGRSEERDAIVEWLVAYKERRAGRVMLIQGEPGIGKSRLLDFLRVRASKRKIKTISGEGAAINRNAPYFAWRRILIELIGVPMPVAVDELPARISTRLHEALRGQEQYLPLIPLLGDVLGVELPETDFTRSLKDEARANNLSRLVGRLVKNAAEREPLVVVLDDAHWFDSASWALLWALVRTVRTIAFVVSHRPMSEPLPVEWTAMREHPDNTCVDLGRMSNSSVTALLHRSLEVDTITAEVQALIVAKAEGNPFYTEQLALSLIDAEVVVVSGRECALSGALDPEQLEALEIPATLQGVVLGRLDRLPARLQLFIKIASVLGRTFDAGVITRLYPDASPAELEAMVDTLVAQRVFNRASARSTVLEFRHMIMRDAVYKALLRAQRVELHRAVLEVYEHSQSSEEQLSVLVHHALHAEAWTKSLAYLERAGQQSLSRSANRECVTYFERALEVAARLAEDAIGEAPARAQLAGWRWHLAEASFRLGQIDLCMEHGLLALDLYGMPMPMTSLGRVRRLFRHIAERNFAGLRRSFAPSEDPALNERYAQVLALQARLTDAFGFKMDIVGMLLSSSRELALAEVLERRGLAAGAHMMLYFVATLTPLKKISRPWPARALALIEAESDPAVKAKVLGRIALARIQDEAAFDEADHLMVEALRIATAHGDMRVLAEVEAGVAFLACCRGELGRAVAAYRSMSRATRYSGDTQMGGWAKIGKAHMRLLQGDARSAFHLASEVRPFVESTSAFATYAWGLGVLAQASLEVGERELAEALASEVLTRAAKEPVLGAYWMWGGLEGLVEVFLGLGRLDQAALAVKQLERFAASLPFAEPSALYYRGLFERARGRSGKALAALERCLQATELVRLPRTQLLAHRQLAQLHGTNTNEGAAHHHGAEALSSALGSAAHALESSDAASSQSMLHEPNAASTG